MAFTPPAGNKTVMVDNNNNIVYPSSFKNVTTNSINIAGNNFSEVPNVISAETANVNQLPTTQSIVNYVADVVEGGSSGVIPVIQNDIQLLGQLKSNDGALHFGAGQGFAYKTGATISSANVEISFMFRVVGFDWEANTGQTFITDFFQFGGNGGVHEGVWLGYYGAYMSLQCSIADNNRATICSADSSKYFPLLKRDVNDVCVVFKTDAYSNVSGTIYFNGMKISGTSNAPVLDVYKDSFRLNASAPTKAFTYKDVCVFNFDVYDANAPYTLADYQQGNPIPVGLLSGNTNTYDYNNTWSIDGSNFTLTKSGDVLIGTSTGGGTYCTFGCWKVSAPVGNIMSVEWDNLELSSNLTLLSVRVITNSSDIFNYQNGQTFINTSQTSRVQIQVQLSGTPVADVDFVKFTNLRIRVNGTLLALENYTLNVGETQKVLDYSGNSNDATCTGSVKGDNDTRISAFVNAITGN